MRSKSNNTDELSGSPTEHDMCSYVMVASKYCFIICWIRRNMDDHPCIPKHEALQQDPVVNVSLFGTSVLHYWRD